MTALIAFVDRCYCPSVVQQVFLGRFFIGYWIKYGLDFYLALFICTSENNVFNHRY